MPAPDNLTAKIIRPDAIEHPNASVIHALVDRICPAPEYKLLRTVKLSNEEYAALLWVSILLHGYNTKYKIVPREKE